MGGQATAGSDAQGEGGSHEGGDSAQAGATSVADLLASSLGAHPDDGKDDWPALAAAARVLKDGQRLVLEPGEYDLDIAAPLPAIVLDGKHEVEIDGKGAQLLIRGFDPAAAAAQLHGALISLSGSSNVSVHDLSVDMERPPFSQGSVTAVDAKGFTIKIDDDFPVAAATKIEAMLSYDAKGLPDGAHFDRYSGDFWDPAGYQVSLPEAQTLHLVANPDGLSVGTRLVLRHNVYEYNAFSAHECDGVILDSVTIHSIAGMGFYAQGSANISVNKLSVTPPPGSTRLMSTTADALHFAWTQGTLKVTDSLLERMGDDGLNVHGAWLAVSNVDMATHRVTAELHQAGQYAAFAAGDVVELADPSLLAQGTAVARTGTTVTAGAKSVELVLDSLPAGIAKGWLVTSDRYVPKVTVTGTTVRNNRARGFLLQSRAVLVDNCTFEHDTAAAIHVTTDKSLWWESLGARDVTVSNCTIDGVNAGAVSGAAAIYVFAELGRTDSFEPIDAPSGVHQKLSFTGNTIKNTAESAFFIGSSQGVTLSGNHVENVSLGPRTATGSYAVYVKNSADVKLEQTKVAGTFQQGLGQSGSSNVISSGNDAPL